MTFRINRVVIGENLVILCICGRITEHDVVNFTEVAMVLVWTSCSKIAQAKLDAACPYTDGCIAGAAILRVAPVSFLSVQNWTVFPISQD